MHYYNVADDIEKYPDAWMIAAVGGRGTGKTYSALMDCKTHNRKFVFVKRTIDDVKMLCGRGKVSELEADLSPFKPINRDTGSNIRARIITDKGLGGFWNFTEDGEPYGKPLGYIAALSAVTKIKGFDMSECDWMIFDEFIPQPWERVSRREGEQVLDLYKTVARDREMRGRPPLKLICLANAVSIVNPLFNLFELTDKAAEMQASGQEYYYNNGLLLHLIDPSEEFIDAERSSVVYKALKDTDWGRMAYGNEFAYNDLSSVSHVSLKGYSPVCGVKYKSTVYYVYVRDGRYYVTRSKAPKVRIYDLSRENEQKSFNIDYRLTLKKACIGDRVVFDSYIMYDIVNNYTDYFKL